LFTASVYCFPSSVKRPFAMRFATRPAIAPKYGWPASYLASESKPSVTLEELPSRSGTFISVTIPP
jgi:hypothetical protein